MLEEKINEFGINLLLRGVFGILAVHFINVYCIKNGYPVSVGINLYTVPVLGCLGAPGLALLYGISMLW